jgi:NitT/TauT family transport system substrate-binding protein
MQPVFKIKSACEKSLLVLAVLCLADPASAQKLEPVSVRMDWVYSGYHAPFFVGVKKGFYKEEGLDVKVEPGSGSGSVAQAIGNGNGEFAAVDGGTMMNLASKGLKVRAVMGLLQRSPLAVVYNAKNGPMSVKDLEGRKIGVTGGEAPLILLPALLKSARIDQTKLTLVNADAASKDAMMLVGQVDGVLNFGFLAIPPLEERGMKVGLINYADNGVNVPGLSLIASTTYLASHAETTKKFLRATVKAYEYSMQHPEEAIDILISENPGQKIPKSSSLRVFTLSLELMHTEATRQLPLGVMAKSDWTAAENILAEYQGLKKAESADLYFTNEYLPAR